MSPLALAKPGPHPPFEVTRLVVKNHDGDTIKLDTAEHGALVIRLSGADTPEIAEGGEDLLVGSAIRVAHPFWLNFGHSHRGERSRNSDQLQHFWSPSIVR